MKGSRTLQFVLLSAGDTDAAGMRTTFRKLLTSAVYIALYVEYVHFNLHKLHARIRKCPVMIV